MRFLANTLLLVLSACAATPVQDAQVQPKTHSEQHAWLHQLVGDWEASTEASAEPDAEPASWDSTEHVRSMDGMWIVAEGLGIGGGESFRYMLTLGYDSAEEAFVGSWIDSVQPRMWTYRGTLDEERRVLTLEAEGPSFTDPSKTGQYRDLLELVSADHKRMTSFTLGEDDEWHLYMSVDYHRKK